MPRPCSRPKRTWRACLLALPCRCPESAPSLRTLRTILSAWRQAGQDAIQLMTVHAAKGLEFDTVFVTGLEEGLFPHENSILEQGGLEEERRLMYVAITRARKKLYVTLAQSRMLHGKTRYAMRSRFLDELPDAHVKWLSPRTRQAVADTGWHGDAYNRPSTNTI